MPSSNTRRLTAVWTRDVNAGRLVGRLRTIASIRKAMTANYAVENLRLENLLENRTTRTIAEAASATLRSLLSGDAPSLQCLLYSGARNHRRLIQQLERNPPEIVYCDGVRSFYFLKRLGMLREKMRVVVDFDDLISRRMQTLRDTGTSLSLGYLQDRLPARLREAIANGSISRHLADYEHQAVVTAENTIGQWADAVTLVSPVEAAILEDRYRQLGCKATVHVVTPPIDIVRGPQPYPAFSRFIFIGPDSLPQNRLTIQLILDLWRGNRPAAEIHLFGLMANRWPQVPGVFFRDYAPSLDDVYVDGAVLFAPGALRGGIKTKVSEAFAFGCAVAGNEITFEGLSLQDYPLRLDRPDELIELIQSPKSHLDRIRRAAFVGHEYVKTKLSHQRFDESWRAVLC